jgi:hypothetical protein
MRLYNSRGYPGVADVREKPPAISTTNRSMAHHDQMDQAMASGWLEMGEFLLDEIVRTAHLFLFGR